MTGNLIFDAVIIFLITYAILNILYEIGSFFTQRFSKCQPKNCLVLPLFHGDETLECNVRLGLSKSDSLGCAFVIVADSLDNGEMTMLWRLTDESENVFITSPEGLFDTVKQAISKNN